FYDCLESSNYIVPETSGYADLQKMLCMVFRSPKQIALLVLRIFRLLESPSRDYSILKALLLTVRRSSSKKPLWFYFKLWLFTWSNSLMKYRSLADGDFDIESVASGFDITSVLPQGYEDSHTEPIPASKIRSQRKLTVSILRDWIAVQRNIGRASGAR